MQVGGDSIKSRWRIMRTNAVVNDTLVLVKPFVCEGEATWCDATRPTKGALRIYPESQEIEVCIYKGCDPCVGDLVNFVLMDKDVQMLIHVYQKKGRVKPYAMRMSSGSSGREDYYINFTDNLGLIISGKHLLHVSCYGKCSGLKKMYIGDFCELVAKFNDNSNFCQQNTSCKYVKPYFAEARVAVSKIL